MTDIVSTKCRTPLQNPANAMTPPVRPENCIAGSSQRQILKMCVTDLEMSSSKKNGVCPTIHPSCFCLPFCADLPKRCDERTLLQDDCGLNGTPDRTLDGRATMIQL